MERLDEQGLRTSALEHSRTKGAFEEEQWTAEMAIFKLLALAFPVISISSASNYWVILFPWPVGNLNGRLSTGTGKNTGEVTRHSRRIT